MSHQAAVDAAIAEIDFEKKTYQIELDTSAGKILLDLLPEVAPGHCKNMIGLAKSKFYDGLIFHRVIEGFMIQGGCPDGNGMGGPGYQIPAEFNPTPHVAGTLSMARSQNPDSAGSQFFVCLGTQSFLDNQYTAFGQTANDESMEVVAKIGSVETNSSDLPNEPVTINAATVIEK